MDANVTHVPGNLARTPEVAAGVATSVATLLATLGTIVLILVFKVHKVFELAKRLKVLPGRKAPAAPTVDTEQCMSQIVNNTINIGRKLDELAESVKDMTESSAQRSKCSETF